MKQISLLDDREWPIEGFSFTLPIRPESTALVVVDVQGYVLNADGHLAHMVNRHSPELQQGFLGRAETMIGNIQRLQASFREQGGRVVFTRHGSQLPDGSDMVLRRRGRETVARTATDDVGKPVQAKKALQKSCDLTSAKGCLALSKLLQTEAKSLKERACELGERSACGGK